MKLIYDVLILFLVSIFTLPTLGRAQSVWHFTADDVNALHSTPPDARISYGDKPFQFAELRLPKSQGPYPVIIIIHGGCWISTYANLQNTSALADGLRDLGFATWNIEYRGIDDVGGGWPGIFNDVGDAVDFLRNIKSKYSLDLNKVIVLGHSAGGHLALWVAGRQNLLPKSPLYKKDPLVLQGVISLGGVPDLKLFRRHGKAVCREDVVGKLLGGDEASIEKYYLDSSPINLLPFGIKQLLIYGEDDQIVPSSLSKTYLKKARYAGDIVKLIRVKNAAHHEYNVPHSITWSAILSAINSLNN